MYIKKTDSYKSYPFIDAGLLLLRQKFEYKNKTKNNPLKEINNLGHAIIHRVFANLPIDEKIFQTGPCKRNSQLKF